MIFYAMNTRSNNNSKIAENDSWPREVLIQPTTAKAISLLGSDYDDSRDPEGDDALGFQIGYEFRTEVTIESWEDLQRNYPGYELVDHSLQSEYQIYLQELS